MNFLVTTWFLILTLTWPTCQSFYNIDDSSLYSINFNRLDKPEKISDDEALLNNPPDLLQNEENQLQTVTMTTSHNEKYVCQLPIEESKQEAKDEEYTGPSVLQLLERLFVQSQCAYRLEHYWTYELCHGKNLRQYHEEREGKGIKTTEYFLGYYSTEMHTENKKEHAENQGKHRKPLRKKIESLNMPYYEIIMKDGTLCDLNGQSRTTRVHYVCYPSGKNEIYSLKESSTCEYEVVVLTSVLCNHPDYKPEESKEKVINCKPANEKSATKPLNMIAMEAESLKLRSEKMYQAELFQGDSGPGSVRIEIKQVKADSEAKVPSPTTTPSTEEDQNKVENWPEQTQRQPMKPLMDPQVVQEFLLGQHCLYGGSGWWKYEFCYGQKVDQYHEEKGGPHGTKRTVLNLGRFNLDKHKEWIDQNPNKRPKPLETRKHVSHFYSGGDICDITGKPRHVEVKLKCKKSESASAVSIYLLEPKTCEYVLGVESPLVCDILASADEYGLMKMSSKADFAPNSDSSEEKTPISTKEEREFVKFTLEDAMINGVPVKEVPKVIQKEEEKLVKSKNGKKSEELSNDKATEDLIFAEGTTGDNSNKDSYFKTKDGRTYTEEEFNTVKEAMMDVYKRIKNNDIDFLLDDYEDSELESPNEDDLASDYDDEEEEDE